MLGLWRALVRNNRGATAVEYGLIVSLIFIAIIVGVKAAATGTINMWSNIATKVTSA